MLPILLLMVFSCKTNEDDESFFESSDLPGMIYDSDNRPCDKVSIEAYAIDVEGNEEYIFTVSSDINGRFTLPGLSRSYYKIKAFREGYESISTDLYYSSRLDVLYLKIYSQKQILTQATDLLEQRRFGNVEELLIRSHGVNSLDPYHLYLYAVFLYEKENYSEALISLVQVVDQGYRFPYVHLLMADIFQYKLNDNTHALEQLNRYVNLYDDSEVVVRIKELENNEKTNMD